ncbi:MAG: hypothetical protein HZA16_03795 [Nitrospirae bacterium]|nr:hypothetical protein [Nitrospirota bacterium]
MNYFLRLFPILFFLAISLYSDAAAQDNSSVERETLVLESELSLAKSPIIYFVFDLKEKEVLLKSRGLVLRGMKVEDVGFWGDPVGVSPRPLVRKSALFKEPERVNIDPNKAKEEETLPPAASAAPGAFDVEALELKDMPTSYYLEFYERIFVSVRPKSVGFVSRLYAAASFTGWYASRPILTIWNSIKGRPFTSIYLEMGEDDARAIYWALVEKSENIIVQP